MKKKKKKPKMRPSLLEAEKFTEPDNQSINPI